jgi:hypothetical protein
MIFHRAPGFLFHYGGGIIDEAPDAVVAGRVCTPGRLRREAQWVNCVLVPAMLLLPELARCGNRFAERQRAHILRFIFKNALGVGRSNGYARLSVHL